MKQRHTKSYPANLASSIPIFYNIVPVIDGVEGMGIAYYQSTYGLFARGQTFSKGNLTGSLSRILTIGLNDSIAEGVIGRRNSTFIDRTASLNALLSGWRNSRQTIISASGMDGLEEFVVTTALKNEERETIIHDSESLLPLFRSKATAQSVQKLIEDARYRLDPDELAWQIILDRQSLSALTALNVNILNELDNFPFTLARQYLTEILFESVRRESVITKPRDLTHHEFIQSLSGDILFNSALELLILVDRELAKPSPGFEHLVADRHTLIEEFMNHFPVESTARFTPWLASLRDAPPSTHMTERSNRHRER